MGQKSMHGKFAYQAHVRRQTPNAQNIRHQADWIKKRAACKRQLRVLPPIPDESAAFAELDADDHN